MPGDDVHGLGRVPVVDAGEARLLALLIEHLDFVDDVGGNIPQCGGGVVSEKRFIVHEHLFHRFALMLHLARLYRDAGDFRDQILGSRVLVHFERSGIHLCGVAFDDCHRQFAFDIDVAQLDAALAKADFPELERFVRNLNVARVCPVPDVGDTHQIAAFGQVADGEGTVGSCRCAFAGRIGKMDENDVRVAKCSAARAIDNGAGHGTVLGRAAGGDNCEKEKRENCFHRIEPFSVLRVGPWRPDSV